MILITGLFLFLIGTHLSNSYPSGIKYGKSSSSSVPCHAMSMQIDEVTKELRHPCESQNMHDNTVIEESEATAEDEPCNQELKEIPPAPGLPPFKLSESPIVVQDIELPECEEIAEAPKLPSRTYDIGNEIDPCPTEASIEDVNETPVLPNLPTAPELPPLVSFNVEEDCDNTLDESDPSPPKPSPSYDIEDEVAPCPTEESIEEVNETPVLLNLPTAPELPPLVSFNEEEDCDNGVAEAVHPPPKPSQTFEQPSRSYDIEDEVAPCPTEESIEEVNETPVLPNLPTAPELPPLVSLNEEEDCDNGVAKAVPPPPKPSQTFEQPSQSYDIEDEVAPCPTEESIEDLNETPVLSNLPTAPELPPLVSFNVEEDCDNGLAEAVPTHKPSKTFEQPSRSYDIEDEVSPCPTEDSIEDVNETPVLANVPTAPELVNFNEEEDCDNGLTEAVPPPPEQSQTFNEEEECDTPDEDVKNHIIIPPAPEIPIIALPKLPLDIVLPKRKENEVKVPLPNVYAHNIVPERVVPDIICRKTNSSNKGNLVLNSACKHLH